MRDVEELVSHNTLYFCLISYSLLLQMENSGVIHMLKTSKTDGEPLDIFCSVCIIMPEYKSQF